MKLSLLKDYIAYFVDDVKNEELENRKLDNVSVNLDEIELTIINEYVVRLKYFVEESDYTHICNLISAYSGCTQSWEWVYSKPKSKKGNQIFLKIKDVN